MDAKEIAATVISLLQPGGVAKVAGVIEQLLILINHLSEDDPVKEAKARRGIALALEALVKEVKGAEDATDILRRFTDLLDKS